MEKKKKKKRSKAKRLGEAVTVLTNNFQPSLMVGLLITQFARKHIFVEEKCVIKIPKTMWESES